MHEFYAGTRIFYGTGSRRKTAELLKDNGWRNIGVVLDHNLAGNAYVKEIISDIQKLGGKRVIEHCTVTEPTYDFLDGIRVRFGDELDAVIGIGGGSAMDAAKAMAVLAKNKKPAIEYRGFNKMTEPVLPIIAIPTTAGTGSEVTPNASFIDAKEKRKMGINGEAVRPKYAILDAELTLSCPEKPTISAGIDSIVHAVEAYVAQKTNPMARLFAKEGFREVFRNLPLAVKEPGNIKHRENVMYGAFLAGVALMNSGVGPAAVMSYPLGVHFGVPHGLGGGIFLPHVAAHNIKNGYYQYADLYKAIDSAAASGSGSEKKNAEMFVERIFSLWRELAIPDDLTKLGLDSAFIPKFVKEAMDLKGGLDQNPVPFYEDALKAVLKSLKLS